MPGHDISKRNKISQTIGGSVRLIAAAVLLFASFSKAIALSHGSESLSLAASLKELLLIIIEVVLSVALLCLPRWRAIAMLGALLHAIFALYLIRVLVAANQHCGCFGEVEIPVVVLMIYNILCSICLVIFPIGRTKMVSHRFTPAMPVAMLLFSLFLETEIQYSPTWSRLTLECRSGDHLPPSFFRDVAGSAVLLNGHWHVILVDENCGDCAQRLSELRESRLKHEVDNLIVIRIRKTIGRDPSALDDFPCVLDLNDSTNWKIRTPLEFFVMNGVVQKCLNED